uniref:RING-type E3 ubiquitin transferase n=1 Tax=Acanthochromis polyacanthus TaxID=80966 RepID=A0A3Q1ELK6_9TELE
GRHVHVSCAHSVFSTARYFHVVQPEVVTAAAGRRGSVPAVPPSSVAFAPPDRRGSEPALVQTEEDGQHPRQDCSRSQPVVDASNSQNAGHLTANIAEERSQETDSESVQGSRVAQAAACHGSKEEESSSVDGAAAAATAASDTEVEETEAYLQSKNITCGICMDKVYEKQQSRLQVFGILPNCSHSFCLDCIMTWRKTRDFRPEVVKSCPQCRVRSPFYVPHKYWVEGQAKERVIAAFKEKFSKKNCSYYSRYGCCPFKTECLYHHDKSAHCTSSQHPTEDDHDDDDDDDDFIDLRNFVIAVTLLGDNDDVFDFLFTD